MSAISFYYFQAMRKFLFLTKMKTVKHTIYGKKILDGETGGDLIVDLLSSDAPCMIARIGSVEMQAINDVCSVKYHLKKEISDVKMNTLYTNAGFFPCDKKLVPQFEEIYRHACAQLDVLAVLRNRDEDYWVRSINRKAKYITLTALEPYYWQNPWSRVLRDKKVLVVNPFAKTIEQVYLNREHLFSNEDVLPEFSLKTLKAVQSIGDNTENFSDWFEALSYMKEEISKIDFDIAILGCGAYAFPLAAYCKDLGKKAIVLGGATQILFGVKGKRWEKHSTISKLFNDYWQYPADDERPEGYDKVEKGCYW